MIHIQFFLHHNLLYDRKGKEKKKEEERKRKVDIGGWDFGASPMIGILSIEKFIIYSTLSFSFYSNLIINLRISYIINKV